VSQHVHVSTLGKMGNKLASRSRYHRDKDFFFLVRKCKKNPRIILIVIIVLFFIFKFSKYYYLRLFLSDFSSLSVSFLIVCIALNLTK